MSITAERRTVFEIGDFTVELIAEDQRVSDRTPAGELENGLADEYDVRGRGRQRFTIQDMRWRNGERDVRIADRHSSPKEFDDVIGRLRMSVEGTADGRLRVDLRVPKRKDSKRRATLHQTTEADLRMATGLGVRKTLRRFGRVQIGTREQLLDDTSTKRNGLCVVFPEDARNLPVAAHVMTRLATLA